MTLVSTNGLLGTRSIEAIAGAETLFSQPGGLSADGFTTQLASLIPLDLLQMQDSPDASQPLLDVATQAADLLGLASSASPAALVAGAEGEALELSSREH